MVGSLFCADCGDRQQKQGVLQQSSVFMVVLRVPLETALNPKRSLILYNAGTPGSKREAMSALGQKQTCAAHQPMSAKCQ